MSGVHVTTEAAGGQAVEDVEWRALEAQASALEASAAPPELPPDPNAPPVADAAAQAEMAADVIEMAWSVAEPVLPARYAEKYHPAARRRIADTYTALAIKHGWDAGELLGRWGEELAFAAAVLAPALPVIVGDLMARKQAREAVHVRRPE